MKAGYLSGRDEENALFGYPPVSVHRDVLSITNAVNCRRDPAVIN